MLVGRFIHMTHEDGTLPTHWTYEGLGEMEGCQTLTSSRFLDIVWNDEDRLDDWYRSGKSYDRVVLLDVSGFSGERGGIGYRSVTEGDIERVVTMSKSQMREELTMIGIDMHEEGEEVELDGMGFPVDGWLDEVDVDEVMDRLVECGTDIEPTFTDTLN